LTFGIEDGVVTSRIFTFVLLAFWVAVGSHARASAEELTYLVHEPTKTSDHPPLIVVLHGSGADENDMIGLWTQLPDTFVVVSPRGPFADAGGGYRWFRKGKPVEADIRLSRDRIDAFVDAAVRQFHADPQRVFLAGFSQGAVMVYQIVLREPGRFRGAAVLSGSLFAFDPGKLSARTDWTHESFFIGHGTDDERIPFASATAAKAELARLGVPNEFHAYSGMHHETGDRETRDLNAWLVARSAP
jgi:phospholipase/carboxylesterase